MAPPCLADTGAATQLFYNFAAGASALPAAVLQTVQEALRGCAGRRLSPLELPFTGPDFRTILADVVADLRRLLDIPRHYEVLLLPGGASAHFAFIPLNLLGRRGSADYVETGHWSQRAITEANRYCHANVVASSAAAGFDHVPPQASWRLGADAAYCHITGNETANGLEYPCVPDTGDVPLVADMSSTLLSRPLEVSRYGLIYASAQKNMGIAGVTVIIVRRDLLGRAARSTPRIFDYAQQAEAASTLNTPPTFAVYLLGLMLRWMIASGGLAAMEEASLRKSAALYRAIDGSEGFYRCSVQPAYRSRMNVCFHLRESRLLPLFLQQAKAAGLLHLEGHRNAGGARASLYNAMPEEGVAVLTSFMARFAAQYG